MAEPTNLSAEFDRLTADIRPQWQEMVGVRKEEIKQETVQKREGFLKKLSSWAAGDRPVLQPKQGEGLLKRAGKFVVNFAGNIVQPVARFAAGGVEAPAQIFESVTADKQREMISKAYEDADAKLAARIEELKKIPGSEPQIAKIRRFMIDNAYQPGQPKAYPHIDKDLTQVLGDAAQTALLFLPFAKGVGVPSLVPGSSKALGALGFKGAQEVLANTPIGQLEGLVKGTQAMGPALQGLRQTIFSRAGASLAAEGALSGLAIELSDKKTEELNAKDIMESMAIGSLLTVGLGSVVANYVRRTAIKTAASEWRAANRVAEEMNAAAKAAVADEAESQYASKTVRYNEFGGKNRISGIEPVLSFEYDSKLRPRASDWTKVQPNDIVTTNSGLTGRFRGTSTAAPDADEVQTTLAALRQELENIHFERRRIAKIILKTPLTQAHARANAEVSSLLSDEARKISANIRNLQESIRNRSQRFVKIEPLTRVNGQPKYGDVILLPESEVLGGRVVRREMPTVGELPTKNLRKQALKKYQVPGRPVAADTVTIGGTKANAVDDATESIAPLFAGDEAAAQAWVNKHALAAPDFKIKFGHIFENLLSFKRILRRAGIDPTDAEIANDAWERMNQQFSSSMEAAFSKAARSVGLPDMTTLKGKLVRPLKKAQLEKLSNDLFEAADGNVEKYHSLTKEGRQVVETFRKHAATLWEKINEVRASLGEETLKPRENYITHLLTETARLYVKGTKRLPQELEDLMRVPARVGSKSRKEVVDSLLKSRTGLVPFEKDFIRAARAMYNLHSRYVNVQPVYARYRALLEMHADTLSRYPGTQKLVGKAMDELAGRRVGYETWNEFGDRIEESLMALDKLFGGKFKLFSSAVPDDLRDVLPGGPGVIPSKVSTTIAKGVTGAPDAIRKLYARAVLSLSNTYAITNLTQFWLNSVPQLEGPMAKRYGDAIKGWTRAWKDWFVGHGRRQYWQRSGVIPMKDALMEYELRNSGGLLKDALSYVSRMTEFVNRVGTVYAIENNVLRRSGGKVSIAPEFLDRIKPNKDTVAAINDAAREYGKKISSVTQFRLSPLSKAPIGLGPWGSLLDQFNSFTRAQFDYVVDAHNEFIKQFSKEPGSFNGWKGFFAEAKKAQQAGKLDEFLKKLPEGQRGLFVRYMANAAVLSSAFAAVGGSFWSEFFAAGKPSYAEGFTEFTDGVFDGDMTQARAGVTKMFMPPSFPAFYDAVSDAYYVVSNPKEAAANAEDAKLSLIDKAKFASYSPFRRGAISMQAFKAFVTGEAQFITDPRTGNIKNVIDPDDAAQVFLFGSRAESEKSRRERIKKFNDLHSEQTKEERANARLANHVYEIWKNGDPERKKALVRELQMDGRFDEKFADAFLSTILQRQAATDAIDRDLLTLNPEKRAQFLKEHKRMFDDPQEWHDEVVRLSTGDRAVITDEVLAELNKLK